MDGAGPCAPVLAHCAPPSPRVPWRGALSKRTGRFFLTQPPGSFFRAWFFSPVLFLSVRFFLVPWGFAHGSGHCRRFFFCPRSSKWWAATGATSPGCYARASAAAPAITTFHREQATPGPWALFLFPSRVLLSRPPSQETGRRLGALRMAGSFLWFFFSRRGSFSTMGLAAAVGAAV